MRLPLTLTMFAAFAIAAVLCLAAASVAVNQMEYASENGVQAALDKHGQEWAEVHAEGLNVFLAGVAPTEAARFMAISTAGTVVDAARVIDNMEVEAALALGPPRFSLEILRNDAGISLIGLIPESSNRRAILTEMRDLAGGEDRLSDFMETAVHEVSAEWDNALSFALDVLDYLPRSKISVESGSVAITAMAESPEDKFRLEGRIANDLPRSVELTLAISAPRPVITPFTLRATLNEASLQFDACSADTEAARQQIERAALAINEAASFSCALGLGVPSPRWGEAVEVALTALAELGAGSVTISDADIALVAAEGTDAAIFDRAVARAERALPEVFALHATLPIVSADGEISVPEFIATLSPEGLVQLRGRLGSSLSMSTVKSYAEARFGADNIYSAVRVSDQLPTGWPNRVMAGLDALNALHHGAVVVSPDFIEVSGTSGQEDVGVRVSQLLTARLGEAEQYALSVDYSEALDPFANIPTPDECLSRIQATQSEVKISFEPGSGTLNDSAMPIITQIAEILEGCGDLPLQIQGHTDSQGRESMNLALSQNRAQSVLAALRDRRVLTGAIEAKGFGEARPIADNDTEVGREANRRIEFVLLQADSDESDENTDAPLETGSDTVNEAETGSEPEDANNDQN